jgi:membrane protease YdiL (CAAX protease family)
MMDKATNWIKDHQVTAFFVITFAITWGLGFSYSAAQTKGMLWMYPLASLATCGPALAGIIITALITRQPRQGSRKVFWIAFFVAWVVATLVWLAYLTLSGTIPISPGVILFSLAMVIPVAFVISMAYSRLPAVKGYLSSLLRLRGVWGWALLALVFYPAMVLLLIPINHFLGRQPITDYSLPGFDVSLIGLIAVQFLYQFFFFNATGEEVGWRGFALSRLQASTNPLIASLILAFFWVPWHFFLWQSQGAPVNTWSFWVSNGSVIILSSIIIGWIFNRSKGSILVAGVIHAADNTTARVLPLLDWFGVGYLVLKVIVALAIILVDRMWKKLPPDHPAVYRSPEHATRQPVL